MDKEFVSRLLGVSALAYICYVSIIHGYFWIAFFSGLGVYLLSAGGIKVVKGKER